MTMLDRETVGQESWAHASGFTFYLGGGDEVITNLALVSQGSGLMVNKPALTRGTGKEVVGMV